MISLNLAASFVRSKKKVLLVDCDLIKPRIQTLMGVKRTPGLADYLFGHAKFEDVLRRSPINGLNYITAGISTENTDEILASTAMIDFLQITRDMFDIVIIDSAPVVPVIDTQILSRLVDGVVMVVSSARTETNLMLDAYDLLTKEDITFLGTVLNNFKYKNGYRYYYKYYYNYSSNGNGKIKSKVDA